MVLNFMQLNSLLSIPDLFCIKNTGPLLPNFIKTAKIGNNQENTSVITKNEKMISNALLKILFVVTSKGSLFMESMGVGPL